MRNLTLVILILLALPMSNVAQERALLGGILVDHVSGEPVMAAHVMNLSDSLATISSPEGAFKIPAHLGDSLVFTSIGFLHKALIITEKELFADYIEVRMVRRNYELSEVEVNPLGTKAQFRKKFMELQVDDGTIDIVGVKKPVAERRKIPITEDKKEIQKAKHFFKSPASFLYGNLSKDAKMRQELHRLEAKKEKHRYNYTKFNEKTVQRITDYEGAVLIEFMDYCNFSEEQIYRYTEYELTIAILNKQKTYERINERAKQ